MNAFQIWSLRRLLKLIVRNRQLKFLFRELRRECAEQWYEDNDATRDAYIVEMLETPA